MAGKIITIARQYGSGGREIGQLLAEKCGFEFYDNNLITMSAQKIGIHPDKLTNADEKTPNSILYTLAVGSSMYSNVQNPSYHPINDKLFLAQSEIIEELADKGDGAVIVGRCADYVLENRSDVVRVFLYADFERRVERIAKRHELTIAEAKPLVVKTDKRRASYYNYYTGQKWGKLENYDMAISTDNHTADEICELIRMLAKV